MSPTVSVEHVRKAYAGREAVRDVSFQVGEGEIFALLGPNGAGKTTTLEILEGFRKRDGGQVAIFGRDPADRDGGRWLRQHVGLVLQDVTVEPYLTVRETIARNAGYYARPRPVGEVIELAGLIGQERRQVRHLSGGQKRRLDLALGIVGDPRLLFLDEPTTGFDPDARHLAWDVVRRLAAGGTTILLTTHYLDEAQVLADQVAVLVAGRIVATGTPETIGGRNTARTRICFALPDAADASDLPFGIAGRDERLFAAEVDDATSALHRLTSWALERNLTLDRLSVEQPSLEDVYLSLASAEGSR